MLKYAIIQNQETKLCSVGIGSDTKFYKSIGMSEMEVEQAYNGDWYVKGYAPTQPLDELKAAKLKEIDAWTAAKITGGFVSNASGEAVTYDSDKDTQLTMQGIALNVNTELFAEKYPDGCPVRGYPAGSETKQIYMLTPAQVMQWQADLSIHIGTCKQNGWAKQAEVAAAESKEDLEAIVLN